MKYGSLLIYGSGVVTGIVGGFLTCYLAMRKATDEIIAEKETEISNKYYGSELRTRERVGRDEDEKLRKKSNSTERAKAKDQLRKEVNRLSEEKTVYSKVNQEIVNRLAEKESPEEDRNGEGFAEGDGVDDQGDDVDESDEEDENEDTELEEAVRYSVNRSELAKRPPKCISSEAAADYDDSWDRVTLYYYAYNEVLTDEDDVVVDEDELVGDCLMKYDFARNGERIIFVANSRLSTIYEVQKVWSEYTD